jgi:succinyl-diaminopimelate desuccinylase
LTPSEQIRCAIGAYRDEIAEFTKTLVAIPTENPPGRAYAACTQVIANKLRHLGFEPEVRAIPTHEELDFSSPSAPRNDSSGVLQRGGTERYWVRSFFGEGERTLYFHGHYDVVPASSETQFTPELRNGNLFGRGSADMKSGLAAMIYAVKALKDLGVKLAGRIGLVLVPDEETGGAYGSQSIAEQGELGRGGIGMLTPEPTGGAIWHASRGAISMGVTVKGKSAHVGLAGRGVNAFEQMLQVAGALVEHKKAVSARETACRVTPESARGSILLVGGCCEGGTNFNTVPEVCSFTVDRRTNPEEDLQEEKESLLRILDCFRQKGIQLEMEILQEGLSASSPETGAVASTLAQSVAEITGKRPSFEMCPGLLETRFYAVKGIPAYAYGPGMLSVSHGPDEFVALENIYSCAAVYALTAVGLLGSASNGNPRL